MAFSRKHLIYAAAAPLTLGALLATTAAVPASAHVRPPAPRVAVGSMELGSPLQYESFRALQGFGRYHGQVTYTNWQYAEPGSGVYASQPGAHALDFTYQGAKYGHTLNGGLKLTAKSPDRLAFSGTGSYNGQAGATWKIAGFVDRNQLRASSSTPAPSSRATRCSWPARSPPTARWRAPPGPRRARASRSPCRPGRSLGAALPRGDPVRPDRAARRHLPVHHPARRARRAGRGQGDCQGPRRRMGSGA